MKPFLDVQYILAEISFLIEPGREAYVVGGTVRDLALGRQTGDVDIAVTGDAGGLAKRLAGRLGGTAFVMDAERDVHRVVVKDAALQVDISPLKARSPHPPAPSPTRGEGELSNTLPTCGGGQGGGYGIHDDLAARDFTVNAMAIAITPGIQPSPLHPRPMSPHPPAPSPRGRGGGIYIPLPLGEGLQGEGSPQGGQGGGYYIDPFGGMSDIDSKTIRAMHGGTFTADPLRLIRAFRLASQLGFGIEASTLLLIKEFSPLISGMSPERVRDEIYLILEGQGSSDAFRQMSDAGLLREIIKEAGPMDGLPQGDAHDHDLLEHSLKAMGYAEDVMRDLARYFGDKAAEVGRYLETQVDGGLCMSGLVKLCAFLHDVGKPSRMRSDEGRIRFIGHDDEGAKINVGIAARLKMSGRAAEALSKVTRWHMRPLHLSQRDMTRHALFRYVRDMGYDLPASLVVALADAFATRERPDSMATDVEGIVMAAAGYYYGEYSKAREEPLIRGDDLIGVFGLKPGPVIGRILYDVEEKRAEGVLTDRDEAIVYVRENLGRFT